MATGDEAVILREAGPGDHVALASLLVEMQAHYNVPCPPVHEIRDGLAKRPTGSRLLLGWQGDILAGFAAFCATYPGPGLRPGLFMKELYVSDRCRGAGIGTAIMNRLAKIALDEGLGRIDWTADAADLRLCRYYRALGAQALPDKLFFRLKGDELARLARADAEN